MALTTTLEWQVVLVDTKRIVPVRGFTLSLVPLDALSPHRGRYYPYRYHAQMLCGMYLTVSLSERDFGKGQYKGRVIQTQI